MSDPPHVSARGPVKIFEAHRVLARHDENVARGDGVQVHEGHHGLVLVHNARLGFPRHDGAHRMHPGVADVAFCVMRHRSVVEGAGACFAGQRRTTDWRTPVSQRAMLGS